MPFYFASVVCLTIICFILYTHVSSWNLYIYFANGWLKLADKEQVHLDSLEKDLLDITDPCTLMLYDSIIELSEDAIKRHHDAAEKWMNKIPKWYISFRSRITKLC